MKNTTLILLGGGALLLYAMSKAQTAAAAATSGQSTTGPGGYGSPINNQNVYQQVQAGRAMLQQQARNIYGGSGQSTAGQNYVTGTRSGSSSSAANTGYGNSGAGTTTADGAHYAAGVPTYGSSNAAYAANANALYAVVSSGNPYG